MFRNFFHEMDHFISIFLVLYTGRISILCHAYCGNEEPARDMSCNTGHFGGPKVYTATLLSVSTYRGKSQQDNQLSGGPLSQHARQRGRVSLQFKHPYKMELIDSRKLFVWKKTKFLLKEFQCIKSLKIWWSMADSVYHAPPNFH